jgi:gamma-glutamylcyclotransferase
VTIKYFAFGSNLSSPRLLQRIPGAAVGSVAMLSQHRLSWRKNDRGQSGKCDIEHTGIHHHQVYGVIYHMTEDGQVALDGYEGAGIGYERREILVETLDGELIEVFTYFALDIDHRQRPYHWYKEHVLRGAIEHALPEHYIEHIRNTPSIDDHDDDRHHRELSIYYEFQQTFSAGHKT